MITLLEFSAPKYASPSHSPADSLYYCTRGVYIPEIPRKLRAFNVILDLDSPHRVRLLLMVLVLVQK